MQAKTFFALLQQGYRTSCFYRDSFLNEMIDIASSAQADPKWIDELKGYFRKRLDGYHDLEPIVQKAPSLEKTTVEYQRGVASSLTQIFRMKSQLEGHVGR